MDRRRSSFETFYTGELRPVLEELDEARRKILRKLYSAGGMILAAAGAAALLVPALPGQAAHWYFGLAAGAGVGVGLTYVSLARPFVRRFKQDVIARVIRYFDPSLTYAPGEHVSQAQLEDAGMFVQRIDRFDGEDLVRGRIGATDILFSEVHAEHETHSGKNTRWHTIFRGLYFIADFNKHFHGLTLVLPDVAERMFGLVGRQLQEWSRGRGELIRLEDAEFEKHFVVYGSDQIEARYILSPALMQRIVRFRQKEDRKIYLAFVQSRVHVAVATGKNMFEPRLFSSVARPELIQDYLADLEFAVGIVHDLNLNTRIWTKE